MDKRVCLDTDVCIDILKGNERIKNLLELLRESYVCISTITMFELLLRKTNLDIIDKFINLVDIVNFDDKVARVASRIFKNLKEQNTIIEIKDIFIAACSINNNCYLATFNKRDFSKIQDLRILKI